MSFLYIDFLGVQHATMLKQIITCDPVQSLDSLYLTGIDFASSVMLFARLCYLKNAIFRGYLLHLLQWDLIVV